MDVKLISQLREQTGAGMLAVKKALDESNGDAEGAIDILRKSGAAKAAKKASRDTNHGSVGSYIHGEGKIGVLVEIQCETDFVARNEQFQEMVSDVAMHVAAMNPLYISRDEVPDAVVAKEREIYMEEVQGKPVEIVDKILDGKIDKYYKEVCLLEQEYLKDDSKTVEEYMQSRVLSLGENLRIAHFSRLAIGE